MCEILILNEKYVFKTERINWNDNRSEEDGFKD